MKFFEAMGKAVAWVVTTALAYLSFGIVVPKLWAWFVVTTFGLPSLSFWVAIGLKLVVGAVFLQDWVGLFVNVAPRDPELPYWHKKATSVVTSVLLYPLVLLIGYLVHLVAVGCP